MYQTALYFDTFVRAVQYFMQYIFGNILQRSLDSNLISFEQSFDLPENHRTFVLT